MLYRSSWVWSNVFYQTFLCFKPWHASEWQVFIMKKLILASALFAATAVQAADLSEGPASSAYRVTRNLAAITMLF